MRRVTRHLFTIMSALSLLLCVAVCVMWVRSYWVCDVISLGAYKSVTANVHLVRGRIYCQTFPDIATKFPRRWGHHSYPAASFNSSLPLRGGFAGFKHTVFRGGFMGVSWRERWTVVPHYALIFLGLLPAWMVWRRWQRRKRGLLGLCAGCGYDLRASPERCPECGVANPRAV